MFRHKPNKEESKSKSQKSTEEKEKSVKNVVEGKEEKVEEDKESTAIKISSTADDSLHELLEKNLKWSQIIYEQNRKINSKLVWSAVASWLRLLLILVPLVLAVFYLPPLLKNVFSQYGSLLGIVNPSVDSSALNSIFDNLPLDSSGLEKLKTLLGN